MARRNRPQERRRNRTIFDDPFTREELREESRRRIGEEYGEWFAWKIQERYTMDILAEYGNPEEFKPERESARKSHGSDPGGVTLLLNGKSVKSEHIAAVIAHFVADDSRPVIVRHDADESAGLLRWKYDDAKRKISVDDASDVVAFFRHYASKAGETIPDDVAKTVSVKFRQDDAKRESVRNRPKDAVILARWGAEDSDDENTDENTDENAEESK